MVSKSDFDIQKPTNKPTNVKNNRQFNFREYGQSSAIADKFSAIPDQLVTCHKPWNLLGAQTKNHICDRWR